MKFTDILIPKSWFKKNCSEPVAGSKSLTCWLNDILGNLPVFANDSAALAEGVTLYINSETGAITVVSQLQ